MSSADQSIGMMDGAYFVGRKEILDWINQTCHTNLTKVEQTCTGAIACQILDSIYPGKVPMSKVDWSANKDYEYIQNYKVLQKCFTNLKIDKYVDVDRLIRGKYQDNLEFMQWFKKFHELNASGQSYDPVAQREKGKGGIQFSNKHRGGTSSIAPSPANIISNDLRRRNAGSHVARNSFPSRTRTNRPPGAPTAMESQNAVTMASTASIVEKEKQLAEFKAANALLTDENGELRAAVTGLETERDFYFGKLRDIEILLQNIEDGEQNALVQDLFKLLYATEDGVAPMDETADVQPSSPPTQ
uniref:Microtubule associated protein EB1 putative n=1 Tax=Albugo laibachii Nc14 TaxID=890382 RepID=F0WQF4_9STRA|nr:microtubule associated protein EB1 putative [Albugo laibachii Nc14]|eukprot:CCA23562.1 microtubule associated protein EB1 putative [Albugo laibachii Nc14]